MVKRIFVWATVLMLSASTTASVEPTPVWVAPEPPEVVVVEAPVLTPDTRDLVERVVYTESGGEPTIESEMAVAQVIKDRADLWGRDVEEVILQPYQFGKPSEIEDVPDRTKEAVRKVFDEGERIFVEPTTHFYAYELCSPGWAETKVTRGVIGGHRFMY